MIQLHKFAEKVVADLERRYVARLTDGTQITRAQFNQLNRYGITTLNDGRVIQRGEPLDVD